MTGIYKITSPTGKIYIGQSRNINRRFRLYKNIDCKGQIKLFHSLTKHGTKNHKFEIIHETSENISKESLNNLELHYWQIYVDSGVEMLNLTIPGNYRKLSEETKEKLRHIKRPPHSEESKKKMSIIMRGNKNGLGSVRSKEHREKIINGIRNRKKWAVLQLDKKNILIKRWNSVKDVCLTLGVSDTSIYAALKGHTKFSHHFKWIYENSKLRPK